MVAIQPPPSWTGEGMWEAARRCAAGGRAYVPLACELPREGLYAPVIFVDLQAVVIRRFYYHRLPDHAPRNSNLLVAALPGRPAAESFRVRAGHGGLDGGDARLADAMRLRPQETAQRAPAPHPTLNLAGRLILLPAGDLVDLARLGYESARRRSFACPHRGDPLAAQSGRCHALYSHR